METKYKQKLKDHMQFIQSMLSKELEKNQEELDAYGTRLESDPQL